MSTKQRLRSWECQIHIKTVSLLVLRAGCGIWLYQFLIIAFFLLSFLFKANMWIRASGGNDVNRICAQRFLVCFRYMYCSLPDSWTLAEHPCTSGYARCTTVLIFVDFSFESHLHMIKSHSRTVPTGAFLSTVIFLSFRTDRSGQKVQTQIRLLLEEQSDQDLHCLQFPLHLLDALL